MTEEKKYELEKFVDADGTDNRMRYTVAYSQLPSMCGARWISNFPGDVGLDRRHYKRYLDAQLIAQNNDAEGKPLYCVLAALTQRKMIEVFEACPYVKKIDTICSRMGLYDCYVYRIQMRKERHLEKKAVKQEPVTEGR